LSALGSVWWAKLIWEDGRFTILVRPKKHNCCCDGHGDGARRHISIHLWINWLSLNKIPCNQLRKSTPTATTKLVFRFSATRLCAGCEAYLHLMISLPSVTAFG